MTARRNLVASALGNGWSALIQVAFVPAYIDLLGVEAYGLIGFYAVLQASLWILDLGFTPVVSREVARVGAGAQGVDEVRRLLRSVEAVFGVTLAALAVLAWGAAPWLTVHWFNLQALQAESASLALLVMGVLVGARLFVGVHRGVIVGAQRLVWLNAYASAFSTLRGVGVIPVLWLAPSIEAFFFFQLAVTVTEAATMGLKAWSLLPSKVAARPSTRALAAVRSFSGAMIVVASLYLVLTQADKVLLSTVLPLGAFGAYALASSVAAALNLLVTPVTTVAYPRLTEMAARREPVAPAVHSFSRIVTLAVAPAAGVVALFADPLLFLWTRDATISAASAPLLGWLAVGSMLHAFTSVPCLVPMAEGRLRSLVMAYSALVPMFLATLAAAVAANGAMGAAQAWVAMNAAGLSLCWPLLGQSLPRHERQLWLVRDVAVPTGSALLVAFGFRAMAGEVWGSAPTLFVAGLAYLCALGAAAGSLALLTSTRESPS